MKLFIFLEFCCYYCLGMVNCLNTESMVQWAMEFFILCGIFFTELSIYKIINHNEYKNKKNSVFVMVLYVVAFSVGNTQITLDIIVILLLSLIIRLAVKYNMKFEVKFRKKKYRSSFMESKYWINRSESFRWNYADLRRVAYRGSEIVIVICMACVLLCYCISMRTFPEYIIAAVVMSISLYSLEFQAMMDRLSELERFDEEGRTKAGILKLLSVQFSWMISRGIAIAVLGICALTAGGISIFEPCVCMAAVLTIIVLAYSSLAIPVLGYRNQQIN